MWCEVKYSYNHSCARSQLYQLLVDDVDEQYAEYDDCTRKKKLKKNQPIMILIGTENNHFLACIIRNG